MCLFCSDVAPVYLYSLLLWLNISQPQYFVIPLPWWTVMSQVDLTHSLLWDFLQQCCAIYLFSNPDSDLQCGHTNLPLHCNITQYLLLLVKIKPSLFVHKTIKSTFVNKTIMQTVILCLWFCYCWEKIIQERNITSGLSKILRKPAIDQCKSKNGTWCFTKVYQNDKTSVNWKFYDISNVNTDSQLFF